MKQLKILILFLWAMNLSVNAQCGDLEIFFDTADEWVAEGDYQKALDLLEKYKDVSKYQNCPQMKVLKSKILGLALQKADEWVADGEYQRALDLLIEYRDDPDMKNCPEMKVLKSKITIVEGLIGNNNNNNNNTNNTLSTNSGNGLKCKSTNPIIVNLVNNMVKVDGGTFTMGATKEQGSDAYDDEAPEHQVTLSDFYIGKYEVTQEEWEAVMGENPSRFKGKPDSNKRPVECVSWDDCQDFIKKLNDLTGLNFRLPTEAEWEYAARGGHKSGKTKYSGGASIDAVAWYDKNAFYVGKDGKKDESSPDYGTHPVGKKVPNELGLYDMSGNVWEWCQDWYDRKYYKNSPSRNPCNTARASNRVFRGGSWDCYARDCRVSSRNYSTPDNRGNNFGLRLALVSPDNNYNSKDTTPTNNNTPTNTNPALLS